MCGIFGVINYQEQEFEKAVDCLNTLNHRGPDQEGYYHSNNVFIGHKRLSIIDLSEDGKQPFVSKGEECILAVNGEIYNYLNLREELEDKYSFQSSSDSEVLLHGYLEWGLENLLKKIDGMYAFVLHDNRKNITYLIRDRFGKKPLFYTTFKDKILFGSEIKAILNYDDHLRTFDYEGIKNWIFYRGQHRRETIYHNIHQVLPSEFVQIKNNEITHHDYYNLLDYYQSKKYTSSLDELSSLLDNAVKKRLMSDVPLGLQLSGGVDSSLIGHFLREHHNGEVHSFSVGFSNEKLKEFSEEKYARFAAEQKNLTHHQLNITKSDIHNEFEQVIYLTDGMMDYPNTIAIYLLSKYSKEYITVALTGEGADELFGGYTKFKNIEDIYNASKLHRFVPLFFIQNFLAKVRTRFARHFYLRKMYSGNSFEILNNINTYISKPTFTELFGDLNSTIFENIEDDRISELNFYEQLIFMDHKTYLFSLLDRQDRASMGGAIEARLPFVDKNLVEWALNLTKNNLFDSNENKIILKKLCENIYTKEFTYRKKKGFPLPLNHWIEDDSAFGTYYRKIFDDDFLLNEKINRSFLTSYLGSNKFKNKNLNYGDPETMWIKWFLMVIRQAQDTFKIHSIK
ncbi:MAG: asparagine synthase (glutamine-hydrolyzing) [Balneolaceae bacterium]|nr:asparagine synthase (glutamine-hydrolyzing) [Balneolaceae bacterium]